MFPPVLYVCMVLFVALLFPLFPSFLCVLLSSLVVLVPVFSVSVSVVVVSVVVAVAVDVFVVDWSRFVFCSYWVIAD